MEEKIDKELTKFDWCKEAVLHLIEMWQDKECLYNPKHKFYHNKHARYAALNDMADKLKVFNQAIGPNYVKNKITYLRGQYSREMAKSKEKRSGSGADDVHVPCVFWYNEMSFLEEFIKIKKGACNLYQQPELDDSLLEIGLSPLQPRKRAKNNTPPSSTMSQENVMLSAATSALESIANSRKVGNEKDDAFCNYLKTELDEIDEDLKNQFLEKITLALLETKREQRCRKQAY